MDDFDQILMNVSAGDKMIGCAALSTAFVNGIKTFGMDQEGCPNVTPCPEIKLVRSSLMQSLTYYVRLIKLEERWRVWRN